VDEACRRYTDLLLKLGPDLQLKGIGENGHWGFHEPGLALDAVPQFMKVKLSEENVNQQMRDHPALFVSPVTRRGRCLNTERRGSNG